MRATVRAWSLAPAFRRRPLPSVPRRLHRRLSVRLPVTGNMFRSQRMNTANSVRPVGPGASHWARGGLHPDEPEQSLAIEGPFSTRWAPGLTANRCRSPYRSPYPRCFLCLMRLFGALGTLG